MRKTCRNTARLFHLYRILFARHQRSAHFISNLRGRHGFEKTNTPAEKLGLARDEAVLRLPTAGILIPGHPTDATSGAKPFSRLDVHSVGPPESRHEERCWNNSTIGESEVNKQLSVDSCRLSEFWCLVQRAIVVKSGGWFDEFDRGERWAAVRTNHFGFVKVVDQAAGGTQLLGLKSIDCMLFQQNFLPEFLVADGSAQVEITLFEGDAAQSDHDQ